MKRKLIRQGGGGGMTIYVPKKWIVERKLKPGDEISLTPVDSSLLLSAEAKAEKKEAEISISSENEPFIRIHLWDLYRLGYDRIRVEFSTKKQAAIIEDVAERLLLGFEVTEKEESHIVLENVTEPSGEKQEVLLRRMFLMIKQSFELAYEDFSKGKLENFSRIRQISQKVDQYDNFCRRNISKNKLTEEKENFYWGLYNYLLLIQHSMLHLYESLGKPARVSRNSLAILKMLQESFSMAYEGFFKKDIKIIGKANENAKNALHKNVFPGIQKSKGKESLVLHYFGEISRLIYLSAAPMVGILAD